MKNNKTKLREDIISEKICFIRNEKVMIDRDLALLYGIDTKALKQAVRRNLKRFPEDFMFVLNAKEFKNWRSQIVTSSWGGIRYKPMAFTEQGIAMLSSVLNSQRAIDMNISIMRAFVNMRKLIYSNLELKEKLKELERLINRKFKTQDRKNRVIFDAIKSLIMQEAKPKRPVGFQIPEKS
jgi:hypothetical protein